MNDSLLEQARRDFGAAFGAAPTAVAQAGGRVNLIGEHTDYHEGFVFPAAIDLRTWTLGRLRTDGRLRVRSVAYAKGIDLSLSQLEPPPRPGGPSYLAAPFWVLLKQGIPFTGADVWISGTVPLGGGLSSSASLEVSLMALGLHLSGQTRSAVEIATWARQAENEFCHVPCGIMDQMASACGVDGAALLIDCRSQSFTAVPFPKEWALVVADSGVKHSLGTSEYEKRQKECAEGLAIVRRRAPAARTLRDVDLETLNAARRELPDLLYRRLHHVVTENRRVLEARDALERGDGATLGRLLYDSHRSLAQDYEVSCPALDRLVEVASTLGGVFGARLTGAGFGGNTVNVVRASDASAICKELMARCTGPDGRPIVARVVRPSEGVRVADLPSP